MATSQSPAISRCRHVCPAADLTLLSYTISEKVLDLPKEAESALYDVVGEEERQALHGQIVHDPKRAVERLEALRERLPDSPMLLNWLAAALSHAGDHDKAEEIARLNYQLNPRYFFARANYAQHCLRRGDLERVREVFDDKFDLKLMYPHRDVFHVS